MYAIFYYYNYISWSPYLEVLVSEGPGDLSWLIRPFESVVLVAQHFPQRSCPGRHLKNINSRKFIIHTSLQQDMASKEI